MNPVTWGIVAIGLLMITVGGPVAWRVLREIDELEHLSTRYLDPLDVPPVWPDDDAA